MMMMMMMIIIMDTKKVSIYALNEQFLMIMIGGTVNVT